MYNIAQTLIVTIQTQRDVSLESGGDLVVALIYDWFSRVLDLARGRVLATATVGLWVQWAALDLLSIGFYSY